MKLSVVTPTADREKFLQGTYRLLQAQTHTDWEWLVYDTGLRPSSFADPRVRYVHSHELLSIGKKREKLAELACGEAIVHFDDDDYYAPTYLQSVAAVLAEADFFTLHSWFSYDLKTQQVYYWAGEEGGEKRFMVSPLTGTRICEIDLGAQLSHQQKIIQRQASKGYGFSYAYRKEVAQKCPFPDLDLGEDWQFFTHVEEAGFRIVKEGEQKGEVIHVIHETNTAPEYPQYRIPRFVVEPLLLPFFAYLQQRDPP